MVARHLRDRKLQRALLQFFKPENYFEVRQALLQAGRQDLIGNGCDCLIAAQPPEGGDRAAAASVPTGKCGANMSMPSARIPRNANTRKRTPDTNPGPAIAPTPRKPPTHPAGQTNACVHDSWRSWRLPSLAYVALWPAPYRR